MENSSSARLPQAFLYGYGLLFVLFHVFFLTFFAIDPFIFRAIHLFLVCFFVFLAFPIRKKAAVGPFLKGLDFLLAGLCITVPVYIALAYKGIYYRVGFDPTTLDVVFGALQLLLLIEATRRLSGWVMPIIGLAFIGYAVFGGDLPGILGHRGYSLDRTLSVMFSTEGVYGIAIYVSATFIVLFVAFGSFLRECGGGDFFVRMSISFFGRWRGGPAKSAVMASALFGSMSGSAMANVMTTGTFTIPLMKERGYDPAFAGAVEASASTGGQIMPPIMGSVAFVMAEVTMTPYRDVIISAFLPALLYFFCIFMAVDFEALRRGISSLPKEDLPKVWPILKQSGYLLIPLLFLVVMIVVFRRTPIMAAVDSLLVIIAVSWFSKKNRMTPIKILRACAETCESILQVGTICGIAGIVIGVFGLTGIGGRMGALIMQLAGGHLFPSLFLVMIITLILGMGMPTVPAYIIAASVGAPVLVNLGTSVIVAHMFVLYYACISSITPPVALASFAGAGVAKADFWETSWKAIRIGIAGYVVPFMFVFHPLLLLHGGSLPGVLLASFICIVGIITLAGFLHLPWHWLERILLLVSTILIIQPGDASDLIGFLLGAAVFIRRYQMWNIFLRSKKQQIDLKGR